MGCVSLCQSKFIIKKKKKIQLSVRKCTRLAWSRDTRVLRPGDGEKVVGRPAEVSLPPQGAREYLRRATAVVWAGVDVYLLFVSSI